VTNTQPSTSALKPDFQQQAVEQHCVLSYDSKGKVSGLITRQGDISWLSNNYYSPVQSWIERLCSSTCQPPFVLDDIFYLQVPRSIFSPAVMEIPSYKHLDFNVSLFWMMTKHKEKIHCIDGMLRWLHWLSDFT
jgi:hypothetical protein